MNLVRSRGALAGFLMVCATLAANALISYLNVRRLHEKSQAVDRSHQARLALATLLQTLSDAETGQRGYLITGEASSLEPYRDAVTQVEANLSQLTELFLYDPAQRGNYYELRAATRHAVELLHQSVIARQQGGFEASRLQLLSREAKTASDGVRSLLAKMQDVETQKLSEHTRDSRISYRTAVITGCIAAAIGLGLAAVGYWLVLREFATRLQSAAELARLNEGLEARVRERTQAIGDANAALRSEIEDRQQAEKQAQRMAAQLESSNRALEQFASVASHDLQEPLRKIQSFGDRLQTGFRDQLGERGQDYLDRMCAAATRMRKLIDDLLNYSRVATRSQPLRPVDLALVAREVLDDLDERVRQSGANVEIGPLPTLPADPLQMRQLFQNLLSNALKFHRPDAPPRVQVSAELRPGAAGDGQPPHDHWQLVFSDNGIGFAPEYAERIFDVFQRLHSRDEYEGTGMGLAICKKIVERHGGTIAAHGIPGQGARFIVTLPSEHSLLRDTI